VRRRCTRVREQREDRMAEVRTVMRAVRIDLGCDACGGKMSAAPGPFQPEMWPDVPAEREYRCTCGSVKWTRNTYPEMRFEEVAEDANA
jgi:hypothetical protein